MGTPIQVICDTPGYENLWLSQSIFNIGSGATINSLGNSEGPCPICKGMENIQDSIYKSSSTTSFNLAELNFINSNLKALAEKANKGAIPFRLKPKSKSRIRS